MAIVASEFGNEASVLQSHTKSAKSTFKGLEYSNKMLVDLFRNFQAVVSNIANEDNILMKNAEPSRKRTKTPKAAAALADENQIELPAKKRRKTHTARMALD
jgi:hypothetical protein